MPGIAVTTFAGSAARLTAGAVTVLPSFEAPAGLHSGDMLATEDGGCVEVGYAFTGALRRQDALFERSELPFLTASTADTARLLQGARP